MTVITLAVIEEAIIYISGVGPVATMLCRDGSVERQRNSLLQLCPELVSYD